jgi:hypothetical protein
MIPFCRIFVTPMEGHVHLCDKNALRERKAIRNADLIGKNPKRISTVSIDRYILTDKKSLKIPKG